MGDDPPFRAEYAKSGRSACKSCKTNIAQASLRIAKMVQSPHFDGKVPNWFHFHCFFKKFSAKSEEEFGHFESLRWDDQEKIREHVNNIGTTTGKGKKGSKNSKNNLDATDSKTAVEFSIEYAKSGRAKCRKCEEKIEKGVIRISKMLEPDGAHHVGLVPHWHHVNCFLERRIELEADQIESSDIPGYETLSEEDQKVLKKTLKIQKKKKPPSEEKPTVKDEKDCQENAKEQNILKKQNKEFWSIRDQLFTHCTNRELKEMLEVNGCEPSGGEDSLLDRCADGVLYGALQFCSECNEGKLIYSATRNAYICTGNISAWTKCINSTQIPKRKVWKIPKALKEDNEHLMSLTLKIGERKFPTKSVKQNGKSKENTDKPLQNRKFVFVGKLKENQDSLLRKIENLGGNVSATVTPDCFCCISSPAEVLKGTKKMGKVEQYSVPVVTEEYIDAVKKGGARLLLTQYAIAPWGGESVDEVDGGASNSVGKKRKNIEEASGSSKKKMTMKGGAIVDPDSGLAHKYHVLKEGSEIFSCVLGLVDLIRGSNSYYKLQVLQHDKQKSKFQLFRSWGRVGTKIGGDKLEKFYNKENAVDHFKDLYAEKTGNVWEMRKSFVKHPSKFYPIDIDYGQDDEDLKVQTIAPGKESFLAKPIQNLITMIFDVEAMKQSMVEFEIDLKKMPLGKISRKQIELAYVCLSECQQYLTDGITGAKVLDASNRFFTLIPHDFGMKTPPLLDEQELISLKVGMLDSLLDIELAYSLLKETKSNEKHPLDVHYESLKTELKVLQKDSDEFQMICDYVRNTHAKTHSQYTLNVKEVFTVARQGEKQKYRPFKDLPNKQLLWHGSRRTNFVGILSQGLRIAPPEAPVTGYMFGKGVYFADMASKSANYCYSTPSNTTGLMLLCEVALGNMYEVKQAEHITRLPSGKHSCKGLGGTGPDPSEVKVLPDGVTVPLGKGHPTGVEGTSLLYNEYIVYDTSQIHMKYLIQIEFVYKTFRMY